MCAIPKPVSIVLIIVPVCCPTHRPSGGFLSLQTSRAHGPILPVTGLRPVLLPSNAPDSVPNVLTISILIGKTYLITEKNKKIIKKK